MISVRPANLEDRRERGWICSTWVRSYGADRAGVSATTYGPEQGRLVDRLLSTPRVRLVVACSTDSQTALHAWACGEAGGPLHYAYCAPELRRHGLARQAIAGVLGTYPQHIEVTHRMPFESARFRWNFYPLTRLEAA